MFHTISLNKAHDNIPVVNLTDPALPSALVSRLIRNMKKFEEENKENVSPLVWKYLLHLKSSLLEIKETLEKTSNVPSPVIEPSFMAVVMAEFRKLEEEYRKQTVTPEYDIGKCKCVRCNEKKI